MAKKKYDFEVPFELIELFQSRTIEYIYWNENLFKLLSEKIIPSAFPDKRRPAVSTVEDFQILAEKINNTFPETGSRKNNAEVKTGKRKISSYEIAPSYLRNICYPENIKKQIGVSKYRILKIYHYLLLHEKKPEVKNINELNYKETLSKGGYIELNRSFFTYLENENFEFGYSEFYISNQNEICQWYGIINSWDILRDGYIEFKKQVIRNFYEKNSPKVIGRVIGLGGFGKSTVLRRLSYDLTLEDIDVIWVKNLEKLTLIKSDLFWNKINNKTIIIIDDYVRFEKHELINSSFFGLVEDSENIRVIIGDRKSRGQRKLYDNLAGTNAILELDSKQNERIVSIIVNNNKDWKNTANEILANSNASQTSLYLLLFIIDRVYAQNLDFEQGEGIKGQFLKIISNDLNEIEKKFPGIGSALHYLSVIYKKYRMQFNLNALFFIAKAFNLDSINSSSYLNPPIHRDSLLWKLLSTYMSESDSIEDITLNLKRSLKYNHELLADEGLSDVLPDNCNPFEEKTKYIILDLLIGNNEIPTASFLFSAIFNSIEYGFYSIEIRDHYFSRLLESGSYHYAFLDCGFRADLLTDKNEEIIYKIFESGLSYAGIWTIICKWIHHHFNRENKRRIYNELINRGSENTEVWKYFILNSDYSEISNLLISKLEDNELIENRNFELIQLLLLTIKDKDYVELVAKKLIDNYSLPIETTCVCLGVIIKDEKYKIKFAKGYLSTQGNSQLEPSILIHILDILKEFELGMKMAKELINTDAIAIDVKCKCLEVLKGTTFGTKKVKEILGLDWTPREWYLVWRSAQTLKNNPKAKKIIELFVNKVIENYKANKIPQAKYQYIQLLKIPLQYISEWQTEVESEILNWKSNNRRIVTSILISHSKHPSVINALSREILESWESELMYQKVKYNSIKNWLHISYALGHPDIETRRIAFKTAKEIVELGNLSTNGLIPDNLFVIAQKIVEEDDFPEWNFRLND